MIWVIALAILTYFRSLFSGFMSDDITVNGELRRLGYPIRWKEARRNPLMLLHDAIWKLCKDKPLPHHLVNMAVYISLTTLFYAVCRKYLPQDIAFLATLFYVVHPCNAQMAGWISGKGYMQAAIIGLLALYFNNVVFYLISLFAHPIAFSIIIIMSLPIYVKALGLILALYLFGIYAVEGKINQTKSEGLFKIDNMRLYPRKFIVAIKSFAYYFCLAMFPGKMGWFHEIGEPIDEKIKSANLHFALSLLLLAAISLFFAHPAFIGLLLFCLMIAPFTNLITPALFTSERYMGMALMGWSIFLAYTLHSYPIACGVIICAYFMRTQLELWAYQDDFHLALYSLLNFPKSGFAWCNMAHLLLAIERKPSAAFDLLCETRKRLPEFPTTYYQLYLMYRAQDLLANFDEAMNCLEKACHYGKHEGWYRELEEFKSRLKIERIKRFKENVARNKHPREFRPVIAPGIEDIEQVLLGNTA